MGSRRPILLPSPSALARQAGGLPWLRSFPRTRFPSGTAAGTSDDRLGCPHEGEVAMVRFYFHLQTGDQIVPDDEGNELPDLSAAEHEAMLSLLD